MNEQMVQADNMHDHQPSALQSALQVDIANQEHVRDGLMTEQEAKTMYEDLRFQQWCAAQQHTPSKSVRQEKEGTRRHETLHA